MKKNMDRISFDDDSDMCDMIDIILRALYLDKNNVEFVAFLISNGFNINYKLAGNDCLLLKYVDNALKKDVLELEVIEQLIHLGADAHSETLDGDNMLSLLAGRDEIAAIYMAGYYDPSQLDKTDKYGVTPLMYAAMRGYNRFAKMLIEQGVEVNATGSKAVSEEKFTVETDGVSPLALAIRFGNVEMVRILLAAGADETIYDAEGNPPVFSLVRYPYKFFLDFPEFGGCNKENHPIFEKKREIISLLEQLDLTNAEGYTVLMKSLFPMKFWYTGFGKGVSPQKNLPIALELIEKGADVNAAGNDGKCPLHQAVVEMEEVARALVKAGADINVQDDDGNTPLLYACMESEEETVLWLLKAGADYKLQNNEGKTAEKIAAKRGFSRALELMGSNGTLLQACKNNQKRAVQVILKSGGADLDELDEEECGSPLIYACRNNALEIVKMLLVYGADPNIVDQKNFMPLHYAGAMGNLPIINLLVKAGADVNCTEGVGGTPLMFMAKNARTDAALKLLQHPEIDITIKDNNSRLAIDYATASGLRELVQALSTAEEEHTDSYGNTTLHHACWNNQGEVVKTLIEKDPASVNKLNNDGESPLLIAVRQSNLMIVELLLAAGAETDCADIHGVMPFHVAAGNGDLFVGKALLAAGADIGKKTVEGQTPLILSAQNSKNDFTAMLIEAGADVNAVDNDQHSALYYASEAGYTEIVEQLLMAGAKN